MEGMRLRFVPFAVKSIPPHLVVNAMSTIVLSVLTHAFVGTRLFIRHTCLEELEFTVVCYVVCLCCVVCAFSAVTRVLFFFCCNLCMEKSATPVLFFCYVARVNAKKVQPAYFILGYTKKTVHRFGFFSIRGLRFFSYACDVKKKYMGWAFFSQHAGYTKKVEAGYPKKKSTRVTPFSICVFM